MGIHVKKITKKSSQRWLQRHLNDPYVHKAKKMRYRSRAAFKLLELDDKFDFLKPQQNIIDLGAAPGSWSQAAIERISEKGGKAKNIFALDIQDIHPLEYVQTYKNDITSSQTFDLIEELLAGEKAQLILSDLAPNTTGHKKVDHLKIMGLVETAFGYCERFLGPQGHFVCKIFTGAEEHDFLLQLKQYFESVKMLKPPCTYKDSHEKYIVAKSFIPEGK